MLPEQALNPTQSHSVGMAEPEGIAEGKKIGMAEGKKEGATETCPLGAFALGPLGVFALASLGALLEIIATDLVALIVGFALSQAASPPVAITQPPIVSAATAFPNRVHLPFV